MPHAHITLVTLGVTDVPRAARFYEAMGFQRKMRSAPDTEVAFFDAGAVALSLYLMSGLAADSGYATDAQPHSFRASSLAWNCPNETDVDAVMARAAASGGSVRAPAKRASWGGYHGHFSDPDGHVWEVAFNPQFPLSDAGAATLPD